MGKIEHNKEIKRQAILAAAEDIFLIDGYVLASMDKIAAKARVTKQTVYRYYPSKVELFKATLEYLAESPNEGFLIHLQEPDTKKALYTFAKGFIKFHLSSKHLAIFKLLIAESKKAPEMTSGFFDVGPDETDVKLSEFFTERLGIKNPEPTVYFWTAILLAERSSVLVGKKRPGDKQIERYAKDATDFLLAVVS